MAAVAETLRLPELPSAPSAVLPAAVLPAASVPSNVSALPLAAPAAAPSALAAAPQAAAPAAAPALSAAPALRSAASAAASDGPARRSPADALLSFWDGAAKHDRDAVAAFAPLAQAQADAHGRVTPALQAALTRVEETHADRFTRGARRAWQTLVARLGAETSLPIGMPEVAVPYWQKDGHPLAGHGARDPLPAEADVVIVGAGLTGASAAHRLAAEAKAKGLRVIVLEAGDPATQASGRNGGNFHLLPENYVGQYRGLPGERAKLLRRLDPSISPADAAALGDKQAKAILRLSAVNRARLLHLVESEGIDADLAPNGAVRAARSAAEEAVIREEAEYVRAQGHDVRPMSAGEVDAALGLPEGTSAHGGRFSALDGNYHPLKYVIGVLNAAMDKGVRLFTRTPVEKLERDGRGWSVTTARGKVRAGRVILATNAFTSALAPQLAEIRAFRSQIQVTEHVAESWQGRLLTADSGDLYGHHPNGERYRGADGVSRAPLLIGGGKDAPTNADPRRVPRSRRTHELLRAKRDALHPELKRVPPAREWAGPTGFTPDFLPAIGELEPGLIVAAGFNGYGGVYTQAAGLAAAEIALTGRAPDWAPQDVFSPKRLLPKEAPALDALPAALDGPAGPGSAEPAEPARSSNRFWDGFPAGLFSEPAELAAESFDAASSDGETEAPWLALSDARYARALDAALALARTTDAGRRALDAAEKALAGRDPLPVDVRDLGRNWGEFDYLEGRLRLHKRLFEKGREAELAGTLAHELLHVAQHAAGLPSNALELEIEAHLLDMKLMEELGLEPPPHTFAMQAHEALKKGPADFIELIQAAVPGSPYLGESTPEEIIEELERELKAQRRKKSARAAALAAVIEQDLETLRSEKGLANYRAFSKRVRAELTRRAKAAAAR